MKPIGVTVITKSYRRVGRKAVSLFKKHTGLEVLIIEGKDSEGFQLKLKLERLCGRRPIIFFDADYWTIRHADFSGFVPKSGFYGVLDSAVFNPWAFPHTDCQENGLDETRYINTGFFACDLRDKDTRKVFQIARRSWGRVKSVDTTDQFHINRALLQLKLPISLLPLIFNYYKRATDWGQIPYIPREIIGLHGAGIEAKNKFDELTLQAKVFTVQPHDLHDNAILHYFAKQYQLL
mgnify:FL=1